MGTLFGLRLVTGEFYARVTVSWVTPGLTGGAGMQNKRPACRWLRSSSHNSADQGSIVTKSLSKKFTLRRRDDPASSVASLNRPRRRRRATSERVFAGVQPARA